MVLSVCPLYSNLFFLSAVSHQEVMMRKKSAMKLETRYETMIENAFYYSNPPEVQAVARKERPPMHEYIRRLLYKDLSKVTVEKVLWTFSKVVKGVLCHFTVGKCCFLFAEFVLISYQICCFLFFVWSYLVSMFRLLFSCFLPLFFFR